MSALHGLYLGSLVIAAVGTGVAFPGWRDRVAVGVITGVLVCVDVVVRRGVDAVRRVAVTATRAELADAARAEERQRLAHDLHDTLVQGLTGVVLRLEAAEQRPRDMARLVTQARELAGSCLVDTRRTVEALRPEALDDASLADAVARVCDRWSELTGVPTRYAAHGTGACWPTAQVIALRVVQEALANTGKHAAANLVAVTVEHRGDELRVVVRDDGRGFDPANLPRPNGHTSGGLGLATMRERVTSVRGRLSVTSAPGAGTTVVAVLPSAEARP